MVGDIGFINLACESALFSVQAGPRGRAHASVMVCVSRAPVSRRVSVESCASERMSESERMSARGGGRERVSK